MVIPGMNVNLGTVFDKFIAELLQGGMLPNPERSGAGRASTPQRAGRIEDAPVWPNCARKSRLEASRPTVANSLTVNRRLLESAAVASSGNAPKDEGVHPQNRNKGAFRSRTIYAVYSEILVQDGALLIPGLECREDGRVSRGHAYYQRA